MAAPMRILWAMLLTAMLATAGCLGDEGVDNGDNGDNGDNSDNGNNGGDGQPPASGNQTQEPITYTGTGMTGVSAGQPGASAGFGGQGGEFDVPADIDVLHAEIRWDDPVQDVDLALSSPEQEDTNPRIYDHVSEGGSPGSPDTPHSITINNPQEGTWMLTAFGNGATAAMEYEWAVTLFYDDMPEGYTAFE